MSVSDETKLVAGCLAMLLYAGMWIAVGLLSLMAVNALIESPIPVNPQTVLASAWLAFVARGGRDAKVSK